MRKRSGRIQIALTVMMLSVLLSLGSFATYVFLFAAKRPRAMQELEKAGHEVAAVRLGGESEPESDSDIWLLRVAEGPDLGMLAEVAQDLKRVQHLRIGPGVYINCESFRAYSGQLKGLEIVKSSIDDLSPVEALRLLESLQLSDVQVATMPTLKRLPKLGLLELERGNLSDIDFVAGSNVVAISLKSTDVTNLAALRTLPRLRHFTMRKNQAVDLAPIGSVRTLESLALQEIPTANFEWLAKCGQLERLEIRYIPMKSFPAMANSKLEKLTLLATEIQDLKSLAALKSLKDLTIGYSAVHDVTPLSSLPRLSLLTLANTEVANLEPLRGMQSLTYLDVYRTKVVDITPLMGLTNLTYLRLPVRVPRAQVEQFKARAPNCTIEH